MANKVKVPGGAFYAGDGLTVDQTTRTVSAGGGSSVSTPDWNQNDATASDYIKNRPFYTGDPVETVLVEESTASFANSGGMYMAQFPSTFEATVGETYKVYWDGATYECTCVDFNGDLVIGNLSIAGAGSDTGEPFLMGVENGAKIQIYTADASASHTFSISETVAPVVKIDPKYIRDMYYTGDPVETVLVEESTVSFTNKNGIYQAVVPSTFKATVGETYKVSWDGTVYECTCVLIQGIPAMGNPSILGPGTDTGEPFLMGVENGAKIHIMTADTSASHTFSISGLVPEVVKIDEKYLPDTIATKSDVEVAQTTANAAQSTANAAKTAADNAKATADNAKTAADNAKATADNAKTTADNAKTTADAALPKSGGEMSGVIKSSSNIEFPRKYSSNSSPIKGLVIESTIDSKVLTNWIRSNGVDSSLFSHIETIVTYLDGIIIYKPNKIASENPITIVSEGTRLDFLSSKGKKPITISAKDIILQSSTSNSTKKFKITVDDSGKISATEVTA